MEHLVHDADGMAEALDCYSLLSLSPRQPAVRREVRKKNCVGSGCWGCRGSSRLRDPKAAAGCTQSKGSQAQKARFYSCGNSGKSSSPPDKFWRMTAFLFSCDHATCAVPEPYREIFRGSEEVVASTEGWEPGSLNLAQGFAMKFRTPLVHGDVTRLLIDL